MTTLSPEQFRRVEELFHEAALLPVDEREAFVRRACGDDEAVRTEVFDLLHHAGATPVSPTILASPARSHEVTHQLVGQTVGAYQITAMIGRGGMGVVYRATDTRLNRTVAIKSLPRQWAEAPAQMARFAREAKVLASMSHPNVATVYGVEEFDNTRLLVMEYIDGQTLAQRLRKGAPPLDEALRIARQIAAAVEAVHDAGVIHRDLKPGNVMLTADDTVKVLDFGLARVTAPFTAAQSTHAAPTAAPATREGSVLGTPGYMSPEQIRGKTLDRRTDIFSFGCILYELLTGHMAFTGEPGGTSADVLAGILEREPDWTRLPRRTPLSIRRLLLRCTAKDPQQRLRDIGDVGLEIEEVLARREWLDPASSMIGITLPDEPRPARLRYTLLLALIPAIIGGIVTLAAVFPILRGSQTGSVAPAAKPLAHFTIEFPQSLPQHHLSRLWLSVTRDGRRIAFCAAGPDGVVSMYKREMGRIVLEPLADTDDAAMPFFSPTGQWIGHTHNGVLWKRWINGSGAIRLSDMHGSWGAHWSRDNRIVFVYVWGQPLAMMSAEGGQVQRITRVRSDLGETAHIAPHMTPNGKAVLYTVWVGGQSIPRVDVVRLGTGEQKTLAEQGTAARLAMTPQGLHLLWVRRSTLFAAAFDEDALAITGPETAIVDSVLTDAPNSMSYYDVSDEGTLVYVPGPLFADETRLAWADVAQGAGSTPLAVEELPMGDPRFSSDGRQLSIVLRRNAYQSAIIDLDTGVIRRASTEHDVASGAISPDGQRFVYGSNRSGRYAMFLRDLQTGEERQLGSQTYDYPGFVQWSPDSRRLAFCAALGDTGSRDIFLLDLDDPETLIPFNPTPYHETDSVFSPDGRWLAYASAFSAAESAIREVYLAAVPDGSKKRQISRGGGHSPQWSPDGKTLYYRQGSHIMAVPIDLDTGEPAATARIVWTGTFGQPDPDLTSYAVAPDGRILLIEQSNRGHVADHLHVILNWPQLLARTTADASAR